MDASDFLQSVEDKLSGKQKKHLIKMEEILPRFIALGVLGMNLRSSARELDMIADILASFSDLSIYSVRHEPRQVVFDGVYKGFVVRFWPQYIVKKPNDHPMFSVKMPQSNFWAIDFAIEVLRCDFRIAVIAIEYDGHPNHYIESGIKKSYLRDWGIFDSEGFVPLRVAPDQWVVHPKYYKDAILRNIDRKIKLYLDVGCNNLYKLNVDQNSIPDFWVERRGDCFFARPLIRKLIESERKY